MNPQASQLIRRARSQAIDTLGRFARQANFLEQLQVAFGDNFDTNIGLGIANQFQSGDFSLLPEIQVLSNGELGTANGAYAASLDKIFVSSDFLAQYEGLALSGVEAAVNAVAELLLEEIGHKLDRFFNGNVDTPGDEGAIFLLLATGKTLSAGTLAGLRAGNDHTVITVAGQSVDVEQQNVFGDEKWNRLYGTTDNDTIYGLGGDDIIDGGLPPQYYDPKTGNRYPSGIDFLSGGDGADILTAAGTLFGDAGDDTLYGSGSLNGGDGNDNLYGSGSLNGGDGNDTLIGRSGDDTLNGGDGDDTLYGDNLNENGNDTINGENGNDILYGGDGNDTINGGNGNDTIFAGAAEATRNKANIPRRLVTGGGSDKIDGGEGNDTFYFDSHLDTASIIITYTTTNNGSIAGGSNNGTTFRNIENLDFKTGSGDDNINISAAITNNNFVYAGEGNDTVIGSAGSDFLSGGDGNDSINGGDGNDTISAGVRTGEGTILYYAGIGADTIDGGAGSDTLSIWNYSDTESITLTYTTTSNGTITGGSNNGTTFRNIEILNFTAGSADDNINISASTSNLNFIRPGAGNDTVTGSTTNGNSFYGEEGNDILTGGADRDYLYGEAGNDTLNGGGGIDNLNGGEGNDILSGGDDGDDLNGGEGADTLKGGEGDDRYRIGFIGDPLKTINGSYEINPAKAGGSRIEDTSGTYDRLEIIGIVEKRLKKGEMGFGREGKSLIIDLDKDGEINAAKDLTITNFFSTQSGGKKGTGLIEDIANISGANVLKLFNNDKIINGTEGDDTLIGGDGDDIINGFAGNDLLNGGAGADTMTGGTGNDTYVVDNVGDIVIEKPNEGTDTVESSITYSLTANVERLFLTGVAAINGTGNILNNLIVGNAGKNILDGGDGNDTLTGGGGADTLKGGAGDDTYEIDPNNAAGIRIEDSAGTDTIKISGVAKTFLTKNQLGFGRKGKSLIIDLNKNGQIDTSKQADGTINLTKDLEISNFFSTNTGWNAGTGFVEKIGNFTGGEVLNLFNLAGKESITGGSPNGWPLSDVDKNYRNVKFNVIGLGKDPANVRQKWTAGSQVWVVIHGWNDNANSFKNLADIVAKAKPNDVVLTLDWSEAAANGQPPGTGNWDAASWISSVADFAFNKLKSWGINTGGSVNLIGHSLGSLVSSELASRFVANQLGGVNTITALDPPSEFNLLAIGGYDLNYTAPGVQRPKRFDTVANFSRAFLGSRSVAGNDEFASWADESILMDFGNPIDVGKEHFRVIRAFEDLLSTKGLANSLLDLRDYDRGYPNFRKNAFHVVAEDSKPLSPYLQIDNHEGVIKVNAENQPLVLVTKNKSTTGISDLLNLDNIIYGTNANDTIASSMFSSVDNFNPYFGGNDIFYGGSGDDIIIGGGGNDTLDGGIGNDILNGSAGIDKMIGGKGNDTCIVDDVGDIVTENTNEGIDIIRSSINYTLVLNVEQLILTGTTAINGTGNSLNNIITGNGATNTLYGGAGNDTLSGGLGSDVFRFNGKTEGIDTITDFATGVDKIAISAVGFGGGLVPGIAINANQLLKVTSGSQATNTSQRFIYNSTSGGLYFDADGSGSGAAFQLATLSNKPILGATDFMLV